MTPVFVYCNIVHTYNLAHNKLLCSNVLRSNVLDLLGTIIVCHASESTTLQFNFIVI